VDERRVGPGCWFELVLTDGSVAQRKFGLLKLHFFHQSPEKMEEENHSTDWLIKIHLDSDH